MEKQQNPGTGQRRIPEQDATLIKAKSYVIDTLEAALWCFHSTDTLENALLTAANLGDDCDTVAAITGQIAGCHYGLMPFHPHGWTYLVQRERIEQLALKLIDMATSQGEKKGEPTNPWQTSCNGRSNPQTAPQARQRKIHQGNPRPAPGAGLLKPANAAWKGTWPAWKKCSPRQSRGETARATTARTSYWHLTSLQGILPETLISDSDAALALTAAQTTGLQPTAPLRI
ncbi:ADP-ribosylglycohydrolase family protein [Halomonas beimenensis]|uniref:ADP-ribosylglycohydrolase family protein n=1 Tax=Halomonas beimenensis TaxID=475662 RepID=UPI003609D158